MSIVHENLSVKPFNLPLDFDTAISVLKDKKQPFVYEKESVDLAISLYNKHYTDPSKIVYEDISNIAKSEFKTIKQQHSALTKTINVVEGAGLYHIMEELNKGLKDSELERLYHKACTIKPSFYSKVLSTIGIGSKYKTESLNKQYEILNSDVINKSVGLDSVLVKLEKDVLQKRSQAMTSLGHLKQGFSLYFDQLQLLSTQYLLCTLVLENYIKYLENLKTLNNDNAVNRKVIIESEQYLNALYNKQATILNTIQLIPLRSEEYGHMIKAITNIIQEADCTLDSKFASIRNSLNSLSISIKAQQNLIGQQKTYDMERQLNLMTTKSVADLARKTSTLSSSNRLQESLDVREQLETLINIHAELKESEVTEREQYQQAISNMADNIRDIKQFLDEKSQGI